jgi:hypothetical protein
MAIPEQIRELRPHATWDILRELGREAIKMMLPFLAGLGIKSWVHDYATPLMWTTAIAVAALIAYSDRIRWRRQPAQHHEQPNGVTDAEVMIFNLRKQVHEKDEKINEATKQMESLKTAQSNLHFVYVNVVSLSVDDRAVPRGKALKIRYLIDSSEDVSDNIWLGASFWDGPRKKSIYNTSQDKRISLSKGRFEYDRDLTIPTDVSPGIHKLSANVWRGVVGNSEKSVNIAKGGPVEVVIA